MSRGEQKMVPEVEFESYYGRPILKEPTWKTPDVPFYLFLGGLSGGCAVLAEGAVLAGLPGLERLTRLTAAGGAAVGTVFLVHDLGRPARFLNMLRVFKPTSPLSVGSFILAPFSTFAAGAAASHVTGRLPLLGRLSGIGAAVFGPLLMTYTAALLSNTAMPAWHEAYREMPFAFAGSGLSAAGGWAMLLTPLDETVPAARLAVLGGVVESAALHRVEGHGLVSEPYHIGLPGRLMKAARAMTVSGTVLTVASARWPRLRRVAGPVLVAGSLTMRFGVFEAGRTSARDPKYVVVPQRERMRQREEARVASTA